MDKNKLLNKASKAEKDEFTFKLKPKYNLFQKIFCLKCIPIFRKRKRWDQQQRKSAWEFFNPKDKNSYKEKNFSYLKIFHNLYSKDNLLSIKQMRNCRLNP
jgi:hypothetical protein